MTDAVFCADLLVKLFRVTQKGISILRLPGTYDRIIHFDKIEKTIQQTDEGDRDALRKEFDLFHEELDDFQLALSRPYWTLPEKQEAGSGGLLSITVNPYSCKGCMECVEVCDDDALRPVPQTEDSVQQLRKHFRPGCRAP